MNIGTPRTAATTFLAVLAPTDSRTRECRGMIGQP
jgi:hypothetical protein